VAATAIGWDLLVETDGEGRVAPGTRVGMLGFNPQITQITQMKT
jgi:hypothetical protein